MRRKEFRHSESSNSVPPKDLCHFIVWGEELLVYGILEVVLLDVVKHQSEAFRTASLAFADNSSKVIAQLHCLGEFSSFRHFELNSVV